MLSSIRRPRNRRLFRYPKSQERLAHDDFITVFQWLPIAGGQTATAIDESSVSRSQVFNQVTSIAHDNARVAARDLGFGIIGIQINVGKYATICVPPANVR